jgi:hypothetical protein
VFTQLAVVVVKWCPSLHTTMQFHITQNQVVLLEV